MLALYLVGTCVATVHLGRHFAGEDAAGLGIAFLAVALGRRTIDLRGGACGAADRQTSRDPLSAPAS